MSSMYNGRRGVNMSAFIQGLNEVPPPEDPMLGGTDFDVEVDADLSLFSNTDFFDLDMGRYNEFNPDPAPQKDSARSQKEGMEFMRDEIGEITSFDIRDLDFPAATASSSNIFEQTPPPSQPTAVASAYAAVPASPSSTITPTSATNTSRPAKRKATAESVASPENMEEASRLAAEEDKRRRNTAASARFRVKKKERERQLEKTAREMTELVGSLNARIQQLETENKWLKNLVMEKNEAVAITTTTTAKNCGDAEEKKLVELIPGPATTAETA